MRDALFPHLGMDRAALPADRLMKSSYLGRATVKSSAEHRPGKVREKVAETKKGLCFLSVYAKSARLVVNRRGEAQKVGKNKRLGEAQRVAIAYWTRFSKSR